MSDTPRAAAPAWRIACRRACGAVAAVALAALAWSAVHDIVRGEADLTAEWTFLVFAGLLGVCPLMTRLMRSPGAPR